MGSNLFLCPLEKDVNGENQLEKRVDGENQVLCKSRPNHERPSTLDLVRKKCFVYRLAS